MSYQVYTLEVITKYLITKKRWWKYRQLSKPYTSKVKNNPRDFKFM